MLRQLSRTAATLLSIAGVLNSTQATLRDTLTSEGRKATLQGEQQLMLFCNITGPCRPCSVDKHQDKSGVKEISHCRHVTHVQDLSCIADLATANHTADVRKEPFSAKAGRQRHAKFQSHQGCEPPESLATVAWFETGVAALLLIALPVLLWRKFAMSTQRT